MDFSLPESVEAFREELRTWLAEHLTPEIIDAGRRRGADDASFVALHDWDRTVADAGWAAISWPREYGGRGATPLEQLVFNEETIAARAPLPLNVIGINNIAPAIIHYGTERQKRDLLPRMRRADDIWCQGMSEPGAGSDLAALSTRAERDEDGFVVNGQKTWTSLAHRANLCALFVRTNPEVPKHKGISCLIVDMATPGVEVRPLETLSGQVEFNEVFFDDVRVPASGLLGPLDGGWQVATSVLSHERAGASRLYAMTQINLGDLVADLGTTELGGRPALADPVVLERLGAIDARLAFLRVLCQRAVSAEMRGGDGFAQAGLAKVVWSELEQELAALGYDVVGPDRADGRWAEARLNTRALTIVGGTSQMNRNITAERVLGLPRS